MSHIYLCSRPTEAKNPNGCYCERYCGGDIAPGSEQTIAHVVQTEFMPGRLLVDPGSQFCFRILDLSILPRRPTEEGDGGYNVLDGGPVDLRETGLACSAFCVGGLVPHWDRPIAAGEIISLTVRNHNSDPRQFSAVLEDVRPDGRVPEHIVLSAVEKLRSRDAAWPDTAHQVARDLFQAMMRGGK